MHRNLKTPLLLLSCFVLSGVLTACGSRPKPAEMRTIVIVQQVPPTLRKCSAAPEWKKIEARANAAKRNATQAEVAEFITLVTGSDVNCRAKLAAVDGFLTKVETRQKQK